MQVSSFGNIKPLEIIRKELAASFEVYRQEAEDAFIQGCSAIRVTLEKILCELPEIQRDYTMDERVLIRASKGNSEITQIFTEKVGSYLNIWTQVGSQVEQHTYLPGNFLDSQER